MKREKQVGRHTPGPWTLGRAEGPRPVEERQVPAVEVTTSLGRLYPVLAPMGAWDGLGRFEEERANVALVLAAPELLAACQEALSVLDAAELPAPFAALRRTLEAAVQRARGQSEG